MTRGDPKAGYAALGVWSFPARLAGCAGNVRLVERRGDFNGIQVRNLLAPDLQRALIVFTNDGAFEFGELWQGRGASFDLASAAFCQDASQPLACALEGVAGKRFNKGERPGSAGSKG